VPSMSFFMVVKKSIIVIYFLVTVLLQLIFFSYCFVTVNFIFQLQIQLLIHYFPVNSNFSYNYS